MQLGCNLQLATELACNISFALCFGAGMQHAFGRLPSIFSPVPLALPIRRSSLSPSLPPSLPTYLPHFGPFSLLLSPRRNFFPSLSLPVSLCISLSRSVPPGVTGCWPPSTLPLQFAPLLSTDARVTQNTEAAFCALFRYLSTSLPRLWTWSCRYCFDMELEV